MAVEGVVLSTGQQSYAAGEYVELTLRNDSGEPLGVNVCVSTLERREGGSWVTSPRQSDEVCTMELRILEPGQSASARIHLPPDLGAGEYRYRNDVERMSTGERGPQFSNAFQVTG